MGSSWSALTSFGTKSLVDLGSAHVVTYGAFFAFLKFFVTYPVSVKYPAKKIFVVLSGIVSNIKSSGRTYILNPRRIKMRVDMAR